MTAFAAFVELCRRLEATAGRLEKLRLTAQFLRRLEPREVSAAVAFLTARAFPASDPRVLGVRALPRVGDEHVLPPLMLMDVAEAFAAVAELTGTGSRRLRDARLRELAARATGDERGVLNRIIGGELRVGVSDGLVLEAIAAAVDAQPAAARRAALFLGDLSAVAGLAFEGGPAALASAQPRLFVPLLPMLAEIASGFEELLEAHGGKTALEYKYDGARIQLHWDGERVGIWTRRLSDVTRSLPDVVAIVRRDLRGAPVILDGEVVALGGDGRPLPFQELMRRFRRVHGVDAHVGEMPLALHFFDCLVHEGRSLIDVPYTERWKALTAATDGRYLAERAIVDSLDEVRAFHRRAVDAGHEGVVAKQLESIYAPGSRGKRWLKLKAVETVDCVIVAADRGSGRRVGWLSNYHLAVVDGEGFAEVGKTFKGFTDRQFVEMTERLWSLSVEDDGYTVRVRPEVVVEVEYNEVQRSPTYRSGLALRFARIARVREDKGPGQATTLAELRRLYEAQFVTKARRVERGPRSGPALPVGCEPPGGPRSGPALPVGCEPPGGPRSGPASPVRSEPPGG